MEWWVFPYLILDFFSLTVLPVVSAIIFLIGLLRQKHKYLLLSGIFILIIILFRVLDRAIFTVEVLPVNIVNVST
jgi:hypothetical protein